MKSALGKLVLVVLTILFTTGCKKNYIISNRQAILFQLEYVNYAWGYQHYGYIIDYEGNVFTYSNPEKWNFPDNDFCLTENQVTENIGNCIRSGKKIPKEELKKYTNYINNISSSRVTAIKNAGADAGSLEFICYQFSEINGIYKGCLIKKEGDFTCENLNFYSKKVAAWMRDINSSITRN